MKRPKIDEVLKQKEREALEAVAELAERKERGESRNGDTQILKAIVDECDTAISGTDHVPPKKKKDSDSKARSVGA